jgi:hypothetical protein
VPLYEPGVTEAAVSSLVIVAVAVPLAIVALTGFESVTVMVSFASILVSAATLIGIVLSFSPGLNVSVPFAAV